MRKCMYLPSLLIFEKCFHFNPHSFSFLVLIPKPLADFSSRGNSYLNMVEINQAPALFWIRLSPKNITDKKDNMDIFYKFKCLKKETKTQ